MSERDGHSETWSLPDVSQKECDERSDSGRSKGSKFHRLLQQAGREHDRELQECRTEMTSMRMRLAQHEGGTDGKLLPPVIPSSRSPSKIDQWTEANKQTVLRRSSTGNSRKMEVPEPIEGCSPDRENGTDSGANGRLRECGNSPSLTHADPVTDNEAGEGSMMKRLSSSSEGGWEEHPSAGDSLHDFVKLTKMDSSLAIAGEHSEETQMKMAGALLGIFGSGDPGLLCQAAFNGWRMFTKSMRTPVNFSLHACLAEVECDEVGEQEQTGSGTYNNSDDEESADGSGGSESEPAAEESEPASPTRAKETSVYSKSSFFRLILINPGSNFRISWDLAGTVFLGWDIIMIPLGLFNPKPNVFTSAMEWVTLVFWTGDMIMSCLTGVVVKGITYMQMPMILKVYAKTWFGLDVIVVGPDWVFTLMAILGDGSKGGAASSGKLLRALRVLRTVRLLRLAKLQRIFMLMRDRIDSEMTFIMINIIKLVLMLIALNHFLASMWWAVGSVGKNSGDPNWIDTMNFGEHETAYQYTTSLHWSICMFTPGSMAVQPQNLLERVFAILILVCGLVVFTFFISSMTASIGQLRTAKGDKGKDMWTLRRFLRQNTIHKELAYRILRYVENAMAQQKKMKVATSKVPALDLLTDQLRREVEFEANYSCLCNHPLFARITNLSKVTMFRLVGTALSQRPLARTDILFSGGGKATEMQLVVSGELRYVMTNDHEGGYEMHVVKDDWLCEPALWTAWTHYGSCRAAATSVLVCIKAQCFLDAIRMDFQTSAMVCRYARQYLDNLATIGKGYLSDVSKAQVQRRSAAYMLTNMLAGSDVSVDSAWMRKTVAGGPGRGSTDSSKVAPVDEKGQLDPPTTVS